MIIEWANWAVYKNSFEAWEMIWVSTIESIVHSEGFEKKPSQFRVCRPYQLLNCV
jgi:hypothetical protein